MRCSTGTGWSAGPLPAHGRSRHRGARHGGPATPERAVANAVLFRTAEELAEAYDEIAAAYAEIGAN